MTHSGDQAQEESETVGEAAAESYLPFLNLKALHGQLESVPAISLVQIQVAQRGCRGTTQGNGTNVPLP